MSKFSVITRDVNQTITVARHVALFLELGDAVILTGGLAVGKTCFVQGLVSALGSDDFATSPTYSIANFYNLPNGSFLHIDSYRLSSGYEFQDLGLEEFFCESIVCVEWGDKVIEFFPSHLSINFIIEDLDNDCRRLEFSFLGERWLTCMNTLENTLSCLNHEFNSCC